MNLIFKMHSKSQSQLLQNQNYLVQFLYLFSLFSFNLIDKIQPLLIAEGTVVYIFPLEHALGYCS